MAAVDYFLKLDGIAGESTDSKHKGEIEVLSFSWGAANLSTASTGGGGGSGKVSLQDIHVSKSFDKSSPLLLQNCATGSHIKSGLITCRKAGGGQLEFLKITLSDILVTGFNPGSNPTDTGFSALQGDGPTSDQFSLNFGTIQFDYVAQDGTAVSSGPIPPTIP
jgi:type VI secretion system secreted protein Hcp